jgi:hypothetical protein
MQNIANCEQLSQILSPNGRSDLAACVEKAMCGDDAGARCVLQKLAKDTPTTADEKLAKNFCNVCPRDAGADQCAADFYSKPDGGGPGLGTFLMELDDQIVGQIDTICVPLSRPDAGVDAGGLGCAGRFTVCAGIVAQKVAPVDACKDKGR